MELIICCEEMEKVHCTDVWFDLKKDDGDERRRYLHIDTATAFDEINYCPFCGAKIKVTLKKAKKK